MASIPDDMRERFLETLDVVAALLELITKREQELNTLYGRVEALEGEIEKRSKEVAILKWKDKDHTPPPDGEEGKADDDGFGGILIVDPVLPMRLSMKEILRGSGFPISGEASNLKDALALVHEKHPLVVILSARLTDSTGIDALKKLREHSPNLKAVMITETSDIKEVLTAVKLGHVEVLAKPLNRLRLVETVRGLFSDEMAGVSSE